MTAESKLKVTGQGDIFPGLFLGVVLGALAFFGQKLFGLPSMLSALVLGMMLHGVASSEVFAPGIQFITRQVLRFGVALLGVRITVGQVIDLGLEVVVVCALAIVLLIGGGMMFARKLGLSRDFGALSGGAVAICGASAAMAISSVLPDGPQKEKQTLLVVVGVTALSTIAMLLYPLIVQLTGMDAIEAGQFLGATIHDVAQVVGAGYMISPEVGDYAAIVKLFRVAMLCPAVIILALIISRSGGSSNGNLLKTFPLFLLGFMALIAINSMGVIPTDVAGYISDLSKGCLLTAVAGLGMKTSFAQMRTMGWQPLAMIIIETVFLLLFILAFILFM